MKRIAGVVLLLVLLYAALIAADPVNATRWSNIKDVLSQQAFFGILTLGVGVVIVTGGIDLSIGSVVGLSAVHFGVLMKSGVSPCMAAVLTIMMGACIGALHATLITQLKLQPFLVTLCGLFVYRGATRMLSPSGQVGINFIISSEKDASFAETLRSQLGTLREVLIGKTLDSQFGFPNQAIVLLVLALLIGVLLHKSVWGRYWYALGHNENAAKYAGIRVERNKFTVYILCSTLASLGGILTILDYGGVNPVSIGEGWELYAITGAVLGGCSLRGGEGSVIGMVLGAAVLPLLKNLISFVGSIPWVMDRVKIDPVIPALIGLTLLLGTIVDESFRKRLKG